MMNLYLKGIFHLKKYWNVYLSVFLAWIIVISIALLARTRILSAVAIFYTGVMPFICSILFISRSFIGEKIRIHVTKWHFAVYFSWVLFLYSLFAQRWASETLNSIFQVDAGTLSITYRLLAFLFAPFGIVYQSYILSGVLLFFTLAGFALATIFPLFLIFNVSLKLIWKKLVAFILFYIFVALSAPLLSKITANQNRLIVEFALWADFSSKNLCTDNWVNNTESVLFLGGDRVLTYHPRNQTGLKFTVETCNFKKTF
jgi:hypothetical protein